MGASLNATARQELALQVMAVLNSQEQRAGAIRDILNLLKERTGCDAVAIRLREEDDYPYYEVSGFDRVFLAAENMICSRSPAGELLRDDSGRPLHDCLCGAVLSGRLPADGAHVTGAGSYWTGRSSRLLAPDQPGLLPERPRLRCVHDGYESLALVPLMCRGEVVGLLQLNDHRPGRFDGETVRFFERLGEGIGISLERMRVDAELHSAYQLVRRSRDEHLSTLNLLRLGIVAINGQGNVAFVNETVVRLLEVEAEQVLGQPWTLLPFLSGSLRERIDSLVGLPEAERRRIVAQVESASGSSFWLEVELHDDPGQEGRRILVLYDVTQIHDLRRLLDAGGRFHRMVGRSAPMRELFRRIEEVARIDFNVLIEGETGTGKELVAQALHAASPRSRGPFVAVNCAGLADSLLTSQLFGHRRGAFTGAVEERRGYFEAADGGTLFLDEVGDISPVLQAALLRVLEEKMVTRVGDTSPRPVSVRVVAATNRDLEEAVAAGRFRADLLYRLRVARLALPPLRQRREDVPLLVADFLRRLRAETGKELADVSQEAMAVLLRYHWPGNVRELRSALEFASIAATAPVLGIADLPPELQGVRPGPPQMAPHRAGVRRQNPTSERESILAELEASGGCRVEAARRLGMSRATFYRRLASLGIGKE